MAIHLVVMALLMGATISVYLPMVTRTTQILGSAPMANVPFFAVALVSSVAIALSSGSRMADFQKIATIPIWLFIAGALSAVMIIGSSYVIPRIGIATFFILLVSGQVLAGLMFGAFGLFGVPASPLTFGKLLGAGMVIAGISLVTYK